jgi:hypothetical protein
MLRGRTAGWAICTALVISASVAHGQSAGEASVRLNGVPVIQVTASGSESATARAARIERRLERLADRVEETARPTVVRGPTDDTRVVQSGDAPIVTVTQADAEDHLLTVDALAAEWASALGVALDQARASRLSPWRRFAIEVRGSVMTALTRLGESATRIIPRVLAAVAVLGVLW